MSVKEKGVRGISDIRRVVFEAFFLVLCVWRRVVKRYAKGLLDLKHGTIDSPETSVTTKIRRVTSQKSDGIKIISVVHIVQLGHNRG